MVKVSVEGTRQDATHVLAKSITFDGDDLETAEMIQAGLSPTEQKVATNQRNIKKNEQNIEANKQNIASNKATIDATAAEAAETSKRFSELSDYDTKAQLDVRFASGCGENRSSATVRCTTTIPFSPAIPPWTHFARASEVTEHLRNAQVEFQASPDSRLRSPLIRVANLGPGSAEWH